jgi:hypothetical protein
MAKPTGKERFLVIMGGRTYNLTLNQVVQFSSGNITLPTPTATVRGGVLRGTVVANVATQTVSGADVTALGTSATTAVNAVGTQLNALLARLRTAGVIASS